VHLLSPNKIWNSGSRKVTRFSWNPPIPLLYPSAYGRDLLFNDSESAWFWTLVLQPNICKVFFFGLGFLLTATRELDSYKSASNVSRNALWKFTRSDDPSVTCILVSLACPISSVAVCCSVLQCVAVCCSMLQFVAMRCSALQCAVWPYLIRHVLCLSPNRWTAKIVLDTSLWNPTIELARWRGKVCRQQNLKKTRTPKLKP